jgi:hypothetical protein
VAAVDEGDVHGRLLHPGARHCKLVDVSAIFSWVITIAGSGPAHFLALVISEDVMNGEAL